MTAMAFCVCVYKYCVYKYCVYNFADVKFNNQKLMVFDRTPRFYKHYQHALSIRIPSRRHTLRDMREPGNL
jgi:hypothetical protein